MTPVLFQLVSLSKESSSLHSLRTPFPTNQQSRIGSLIGQCRGVFPRLPAASPAAVQAGLADMDPPGPPSEGRSGHQLPQSSCPEGLGCPGVIFPTAQRLNTHLPPHARLLAAGSLAAKLPVLVPQCHKPHCVWGCMIEVLSKETPGLKQRKNFQAGSLLGTNLSEVTQPQASP